MKIADGLHIFQWNSPYENNCNAFLIDDNAKILIDPGHLHLFDHVAVELQSLGISISDIDLILATHGHRDHFEAAELFKNEPARFAMSSEDYRLTQMRGQQPNYLPDFFLGPGRLNVKTVELEIIPSPGHSPGSVALYWAKRKALFSGDVIFRDGLGRTDLPGGNGATLKQSIMNLEACDSEFLLPGHGDMIRGAAEVKSNFKRVADYWFAYI